MRLNGLSGLPFLCLPSIPLVANKCGLGGDLRASFGSVSQEKSNRILIIPFGSGFIQYRLVLVIDHIDIRTRRNHGWAYIWRD